MIQRPLGRQNVHEAEIQPVHRHCPRHRLERLQPPQLPEAPARVAGLLQQRQRQAPGCAQVPSPLLRDPLEEDRLTEDVYPANPEDLVQVAEGDRGVQLGGADWGTDACVGNVEASPVLGPEIAGLRHRRKSDRSQVGQQLGELVAHRLYHHRIGGTNQGAPRLLIPELKVLSRNEFIPDDTAGNGPESDLVAGVDDLFGSGRIEVGDRLGAEDQNPVSCRGDGKSPPDLAVYLDSAVGTDSQALTGADARLIVDDRQQRLIHRHRDGVGGAYADAGQARDAELGVNDEIQGLVRQGEGEFAI